MMKNAEKGKSFAFCFFALVFVSCVLLFLLGGCGYAVKADRCLDRLIAAGWTLGSDPEAHAQLGETEAEGHRRHLRNLRIDQQEMMWDIDRFFLTDQPSQLSDKRIP